MNKPKKLTSPVSKVDTIIHLLKNGTTFIPISNILELNVIDTSYSYSSKSVYCDTAVQVSPDIFYSIISLGDTLGICSHYFILTIDETNKTAITSKYLHQDCDIDYSSDSYDLFDHKIVSKDSIRLTQRTIYQKKNRTSNNEEENIELEETKASYFIIRPTGQIISYEK